MKEIDNAPESPGLKFAMAIICRPEAVCLIRTIELKT
jgi:hypothetical protein